MGENIKILEEFIKYYESEAISRKFRGTLSISVDEYDIDAIEHLIKAYKELEEENKKWEKYCTEDLEKQITDLNNKIVELEHNSIPVSLVEEKIEELKSNPLKIKQNDKYYYETHAYNKIIISVLQELIEER